jgi:carboxypeptidase Taq
MHSYAEILTHWKKIETLKGANQILEWDFECYMPTGSQPIRQAQTTLLKQIEHEWMNNPAFKEAVLSDKVQGNNDREKRNLKLWKKQIALSEAVDTHFVEKISKCASNCNMLWRKAREESDFKIVKDTFCELVDLNKEQIQRYKESPYFKEKYHTKSPYAVAYDLYESSHDVEDMEKLLRNLCLATKERLPALQDRVKKNPAPLDFKSDFVKKPFLEELMKSFGFDFNKGRLDASTHPFCGGTHGDVRVTTRKKIVDPLEDLYSALHEMGHALYEQGLPQEHVYEPSGQSCSMSVHESQSRFFENIIGRSMAFSHYLAPRVGLKAERTFDLLNPIKLSFVRVDADEVTYNLHVLLRFELERDLLNGTLKAKDLPEAWKAKFKEIFNLEIKKDSEGCLQDTHWYSGAFGYFPTYSLGNIFAAELFKDFSKDHKDWEEKIMRGDFAFVREYMSKKVYPHASTMDPPECMEKIIARKPCEKVLLEYFDNKFQL